MGNSLEHLLAEGVISEIIARLKSGKEADVYAVRQGGKVIAAKVYKDRAHRSFKNNSAYKEGRSVRSSRSQRAMDRGSKFGKEAAEDAWKATEANTLYKLHAAGVRVPTPVMYLEGVLFMELVLDANGQAAPRLIDSDLSVDDAHGAYMDMLTQLVRILSCDLIHGDLSPYNVLWAVTGPTIIDFPQCVSASHSSNSENFFLRDARNILGHFAAIDPRLRSRSGDAAEIWRAYVRRELGPDFVPTGRPARPEPRPRVPEPRPRVAEPSAPRPTGHRGPPPQPNAHAQQRNAPGPRQAFTPPDQGLSSSHRNPPPTRNTFASAPKSHPAPGLSRGGPRRPDVIVLTRRSGKPSGAAEPRPPGPAQDSSSGSAPRFRPRSDSNPNPNPRFSPNPRSDSNPNPSSNPNPRFSPNPRSDSNSNSNPRFGPNPRSDSNPNPRSNSNPRSDPRPNSNPRPNASASPNRGPNVNRNPNANARYTSGPNQASGASDGDASSPNQRKRRRRRH